MSRRARERANARPWEQDPEPEDHRHDGDFPERCPDTDVMPKYNSVYGGKKAKAKRHEMRGQLTNESNCHCCEGE